MLYAVHGNSVKIKGTSFVFPFRKGAVCYRILLIRRGIIGYAPALASTQCLEGPTRLCLCLYRRITPHWDCYKPPSLPSKPKELL
jgi:hypothetical protein